MREYAKTDVAFMNSGSLRKDLYAGNITLRDVWEIHPFNNYFVTFRVKGETLASMIAWQAARKGEFMQVSGLRYTFDSSKPFGAQVLSIEVLGRPIEKEKVYSVVVNNYTAGHLYEFFGLSEKDLELTPLPEPDREVFADAIRKQKRIASRVEGRIVDVAKR